MVRSQPHGHTRWDLWICLVLVAGTLAVYGQVRNHEFISYDTHHYVSRNEHVRKGVQVETLLWAFTAKGSANWHPLTWISHMLDVQVFGLDPGPHHMTNVLFHTGNTLLLFWLFRRMTGDLWKSGFLAALFALHPLHVESVAWVAERKDVLSTFFWMLTLLAYFRYVTAPGVRTYLPVFVCFALGLMSKPMVVTLPLVLFLLDYWPLERTGHLSLRLRVLEKVPLLALSAALSVLTFLLQREAGAVGASDLLPFPVRLSNALVSYAGYIVKMFYPHRLAVLYPHPGAVPLWKAAGAGFLLILISYPVVRFRRPQPYLVTGWLWYAGTLVPVIGLVQVGAQAMADRYTYIPLIGLFVMIAWGVPEILSRCRVPKAMVSATAGAVVLGLAVTAWSQAGRWKDSISLYTHTISVTENNSTIHYNLGNAYLNENRPAEAVRHFSAALAIDPLSSRAHNNLGMALVRQGKKDSGLGHFLEALRINPHFADAYNNIGNFFLTSGAPDKAIAYYDRAIGADPDFAKAHNNKGLALVRKGSLAAAIRHFEKALRSDPRYAAARRNLERSEAVQQRIDRAVSGLRAVLNADPGSHGFARQLDTLQLRKKALDEAIAFYRAAVSVQPGAAGEALNLEDDRDLQDVLKEYQRLEPYFQKLPETESGAGNAPGKPQGAGGDR